MWDIGHFCTHWPDGPAGRRDERRRVGMGTREFLGVGWLYLQLVVGTVYLLVVINFKRLQELEVEGVAPLYSDTVVAAQVGGVGLGVLQAGDVAGGLRE